MPQAMQIGEMAQRTGLSIDTIRFYEKQGLLRPPIRSDGGFRLFRSDDVRNLNFIRQAQELGFSLREIRELLILRDTRVQSCSHVRELLQQKLAAVQEKISELRKLEADLGTALRKCSSELKRKGEAREESCPVLEQIARTSANQGV